MSSRSAFSEGPASRFYVLRQLPDPRPEHRAPAQQLSFRALCARDDEESAVVLRRGAARCARVTLRVASPRTRFAFVAQNRVFCESAAFRSWMSSRSAFSEGPAFAFLECGGPPRGFRLRRSTQPELDAALPL